MAKEYKDLVVGLDIGTAKVMVVVAEIILAARCAWPAWAWPPRTASSAAWSSNIDATVQSIQQALKEAEMMAACKISSVYTGITGSHIRGQNSTGMVHRARQPRGDAGRRRARGGDGQGHQHPQRPAAAAGGAAGVRDRRARGEGAHRHERQPPGGQGPHRDRLAERGGEHPEVRAPLRPGGGAPGAQPQRHRSGRARREDEKELGVAVVDIGAGTTDVQIYTDGRVRHTAVIPIAGRPASPSDIAMALRTPTKDAEEIKVEHGVAEQLLADPSEHGRGARAWATARRACSAARRWLA
jgi:cell division protein FtsA